MSSPSSVPPVAGIATRCSAGNAPGWSSPEIAQAHPEAERFEIWSSGTESLQTHRWRGLDSNF